MAFRQQKVDSLLRNIVSSFIKNKFYSGTLISVMKVETSKDFKKANIFISIFPEKKEKEILELLKKEMTELKNYAKSKFKMKFLPFFEIKIDKDEKKRERIEEILRN
jgi:ribosome-binding factor A